MRLLILFWLSGLLLVSGVVTASPAQAGDEEINILVQRAESQFPDGIRFFVEAESPDEIDDIRVFFKKIGQTNRLIRYATQRWKQEQGRRRLSMN